MSADQNPGAFDGALKAYVAYLGALERFDIERALVCFTDDVEYFHHPFNQVHVGFDDDTEWHRVVGQQELRAFFEFRGPDPILHRITGFARSGDLCFAEGYTPGDNGQPAKVTWISIFTVDADDRMRRMHQYIQWPSVTRLGGEDISCAEPPWALGNAAA